MTETVLITGGSRGIGRATAVLFAAKGWNVALSFVGNQESADETCAMCERAGFTGNVIARKCDVRDEDSVIALFEAARDRFGAIDAVVNNAGIVARQSTLADMDIDRIKAVFDTNVLGAYLVAREAARTLRSGTAIVNVSSIAAKLGSPDEYIDYAGSKAAIDTLTIGLSKELGPKGIRVNAVRPGIIETDIHASGGRPERAHELGPNCPLGRAGDPQEVAQSIFWLISGDASYVTGSIIDVSGGR
ncbi:SDR family oxidoreductase [Thalassospira sp. ER-Se-21-Dark]|uniref:SDR family oxidoreductase n=1 Tax=Thalassospira sp. ER-Se-21-Dark TaxID=2585190 RepID=UPI001B31075B|nr:SDR family oxidoreductase [Thalassospira sp. ER-Se-21-Dark]MBP3124616.1 SDR family oxidoreductase [Thalassospira sp. ER-Se-21-Dark]